MKKIQLLTLLFWIGLVVSGIYLSCKKEEFEPLATIQVLNSRTKKPVEGAQISVKSSNRFYANNSEGITDVNGTFTTTIRLGEYLADSISFLVTRDGYAALRTSRVIGNVQKTTFELEIDPLENLSFNPPDKVNILPGEFEKTITIFNSGVRDVLCNLSVSHPSWMSVEPAELLAKPSGSNFKIIIKSIPNDQDCVKMGYILIRQEGSIVADTLPVCKSYPDTISPTAFFSHSGPDPFAYYEGDTITFNASQSADNCSSDYLSYNWNFEGVFQGPDPDLKTTTHRFDIKGTYDIKLQVSDLAGNTSVIYTKTITIKEKPTPPILASLSATPSGQILLAVSLSCNLLNMGNTYNQVDDHGFVWSAQNTMPVVDCPQCTTKSLGARTTTGSFFALAENLKPNTKYYVRAYAKNATGTAYFPSSGSVEVIPHFLDYKQVANPNGLGNINFTLGSNNGTATDQGPAQSVILTPFLISRTEITNEQYAAFLRFQTILDASQIGGTWIDLNVCKVHDNGGNQWAADVGFENKPVVGVTYEGARAFCLWEGGDLPTEAQWECAALHKNDPFVYSGSNTCGNVAWYTINSLGQIQPVGVKDANGYGLVDMSGNAMEWCRDWYEPFYPINPPPDPVGPASSSTGERVVRGGAFNFSELFCQTKYRYKWTPTTPSPFIGFRCVKY